MARLMLALVVFALAAVAAPKTARAEPPIYVARGAHASVYFIGTLHAMRPTFSWDRRRLSRLIDALPVGTSEVWTEIGDMPDRSELGRLVQSAGYDPAHPLATRVGAGDIVALRSLMQRNGVPPDRAHIAAMRPWMAWATADGLIIQDAGMRRDDGVEPLVTGMAHARGLPVHGLETAAEQIGILAGLPDDTAAALLHAALAGSRNAKAHLNDLADAWAAGDEAALARSAAGMMRESGAAYASLLTERNHRWAERIAGHLNGTGNWLVAVGAAHLVGDDSLLAILRARGISVTRLTGDAAE